MNENKCYYIGITDPDYTAGNRELVIVPEENIILLRRMNPCEDFLLLIRPLSQIKNNSPEHPDHHRVDLADFVGGRG